MALMSEDIDKREDLHELRKIMRLHDRQLVELKNHLHDFTMLANDYMAITNRTLKLHEQAIGVLSARQKEMREGK